MNYGVVLAGGKGTRLGAEKNKVLLKLKGRPILYYSIKAFIDAGIFDKIVVVAGEPDQEEVWAILNMFEGCDHSVVIGGKERQDSVRNALDHIVTCCGKVGTEDRILIHDSARPLVTVEEILRVAEGLDQEGSVTLAVRSKDTIKKADAQGYVKETLDRQELWQISTPQGFRLELLLQAYDKAVQDGFYGTDDCSLVERIGERIRLIEGSYRNIKVTTVEDMKIAEALMSE